MKVQFSVGKRGLDLCDVYRSIVAKGIDNRVTLRLSHGHYGKRITVSGNTVHLLNSSVTDDIDARILDGQLTYAPEMYSPQHFTAVEHGWRARWLDIFRAMTTEKQCDYVTFLVTNRIIAIDTSCQYTVHSNSHLGNKLATHIHEWLTNSVGVDYRDWLIRRAMSMHYDPLPFNQGHVLNFTEWFRHHESTATDPYVGYVSYLVLTGQMSITDVGIRYHYSGVAKDAFRAVSLLTGDDIAALKVLYDERAPKHLHNPLPPLTLALGGVKSFKVKA